MAIGRTYEESLLKAIRSLEYGVASLRITKLVKASILIILKNVFHTKMMNDYFSFGEAIRRGTTLEEIHNMTQIDYFFLQESPKHY